MGILTGIAVKNRLIADIGDSISAYFDGELKNHADKRAITIRSLIAIR